MTHRDEPGPGSATVPRLVLPWHLMDPLPDDLGTSHSGPDGSGNLGPGTDVIRSHPGTTGEPWTDLIDLYRPLRDAVTRAAECQRTVVVVSGDCVASLAVLAGIQHTGVQPALVWFDAHGDFHTEETTTSGYLGGLPLAKAVGRGDRTLPDGLGLHPVPESSVALVGARDLDPPEVTALERSAVRRFPIVSLDPAGLPDIPTVVHVDVDVVDPGWLPGLRFPAPGGPGVGEVVEAVRAVVAARSVVALDLAATWSPDHTDPGAAGRLLQALAELVL